MCIYNVVQEPVIAKCLAVEKCYASLFHPLSLLRREVHVFYVCVQCRYACVCMCNEIFVCLCTCIVCTLVCGICLACSCVLQ